MLGQGLPSGSLADRPKTHLQQHHQQPLQTRSQLLLLSRARPSIRTLPHQRLQQHLQLHLNMKGMQRQFHLLLQQLGDMTLA